MDEKVIKNLKNDFLFLGILEIIIFVLSIFVGMNSTIVTSVIFGITLFVGFSYAKQKKKTAGTIGIVVAILMIVTGFFGSIIDFLLGIFLLLHSNKYNKMFK